MTNNRKTRSRVTKRELPEAGRTSLTVAEWAASEGFSRAFGYDLIRRGLGPRWYKAGALTRITVEAREDWHREREQATAAKAAREPAIIDEDGRSGSVEALKNERPQ